MRLTFALAALLAASPALADRAVTGAASYPQRIALPEGAELALDLTDASGTLVAELRQPLQRAQVPLPFRIEAPENVALTLQAALLADGTPIWVAEPVAIEAGANDADLGTLRLRPHRPMGFATRFRCGEAGLELGYTNAGARLRIGATWFDLVPGAAAGLFTDPADPGTFASTRGGTLTVSLRGTPLPDCRAELPGATPFRAGGFEPGWSLVIDAGTVTISKMGSDTPLVADLPAPEAGPEGTRRYTLPEAAFTVADRLCRDVATGMPHPATVTVELAGEALRGCGGDPFALLEGVTWQVEDIGGRGIPDGAHATLRFLPRGRVAGRTGCNSYNGSADLTGEGLTFGPAALTRMACPPALTQMEADFLSGLQETDRFDFTDDGALQLIGGDRVLLTARF